ncbi:MAG: hypothetical protein PVG45_02285 [Gammaproteobacteria bacterium]
MKTFIILADNSSLAVIAAVHFGIACASHIRKTTRITFLLVESLLNHARKPEYCFPLFGSTMIF